jgi:radical SAM superfamily enzyme YgiQ (UPF0313 family)
MMDYKKENKMKTCICTTPVRETPTKYPPFGCMEIIKALRKIGKETVFYNIDYHRPNHEEISSYFRDNQFDIVGISAVVSTAYSYTKYLSETIKTVSPNTTIIIGGNLAASAEILLRKCKVDFCVIGNGEFIIQDLITVLAHPNWNYDQMKQILGICFLDPDEEFHFTGFRKPPHGEEMEFPDYEILEADDSLPYYIEDTPGWYIQYGLEIPKDMRGKRNAVVQIAKGCANRCTFCHRWEKGYRFRPLDKIKEHIILLKTKYNVGFISIADESFGTNRKLTLKLAQFLNKMKILWRSNAVRSSSIDRETLFHWKANGCCAVTFGIESGSQTILNVMEKNTSVQTNINALKWCYEADLVTSIQLVLGMPGENDQTIRETIEFLKECMPYYSTSFRGYLNVVYSINYAQALPGSPLYEYARHHGFIGRTIDDEEKYLIKISDINASNTQHYVNCTKLPLLKVLMWRPYLIGITNAHYIQKFFGISLSFIEVFCNLFLLTLRVVLRKLGVNTKNLIIPLEKRLAKQLKTPQKGNIVFNNELSPIAIIFLNSLSGKFFYPLFLFIAGPLKRANSPWQAFSLIFEFLGWKLRNRFQPDQDIPTKSLRKLFKIELPKNPREGNEKMIPIRYGR